MKYGERCWLLGAALGVAAGCSGQYHVGSDAPNADGLSEGGAPASFAGASSVAGTGSAAAGAGIGGAYAVAGASSDPGPGTFCGYQLPTAHSVEFASPSIVYQRMFKFLFDLDQPPTTTLPSETTREWAGTLAASALASLNTPSAQGMNRFVNDWWPGTPTAEYWAAYFSSRRGTLVDLLTTSSLLANGAGLLTDPSVLSREVFSGRGGFVLNRLVCIEVGPPGPAGEFEDPPLVPGRTRRSQREELVAHQPCTACHSMMDPYGFALAEFATDGSFRTIENDLPIDTEVAIWLPQSGNQTVLDAQNLGSTLANSCEVALCLVERLLHDAQRSADLPHEASEPEMAEIAAQFTASGLSLPDLVRLVVESDAFLSAD